MINHPNRRKKASTSHTAVASPRSRTPRARRNHDAEYETLRQSISLSFERWATAEESPIFTTAADGLFDLYLKHLPAEKNIHKCSACRRFIENYGGLVHITGAGDTIPIMWDVESPPFYAASWTALFMAVAAAPVTGVFLSDDREWGNANTGPWTHFAVRQPETRIYHDRLLTPGQKMAERRQDFITVEAALADFSPKMLAEAMRLLESASLAQSEKFIGPVQWLQDLHTCRESVRYPKRDNLLWRAIATAPAGYCHPRSSVIGSLIEDIAAKMPFATVQARFNAKMHPLKYQRPQAAPTVGAIMAAETAIEKLGIARSLERRFARLDECETLWKPFSQRRTKTVGGMFSHITPKGSASPSSLALPRQTMTWEKFSRVVLPEAETIEIDVPTSGNFMAVLTAEHADAPLIMKWGNPFSHYVYHGGSPAHQWGINIGWKSLTAITAFPPMWGDNPQPHLGDGVLFVIDGAMDRRSDQGNALFPATLRADLHGVRSVIEAYSNTATIRGRGNGSVCGLAFPKGGKPNYIVRMTSRGTTSNYLIDRWD